MEIKERGQLKLEVSKVKSKKERREQMKGRKHFYGTVISSQHDLTCPLGPGSPDKPCHSKHRDFVIFTFITSIHHFCLTDTH